MRIEYAGTVLARPDYAHVGYISAERQNQAGLAITYSLLLALALGVTAAASRSWRVSGLWGRVLRIALWSATAAALLLAALWAWWLASLPPL